MCHGGTAAITDGGRRGSVQDDEYGRVWTFKGREVKGGGEQTREKGLVGGFVRFAITSAPGAVLSLWVGVSK
jgi:hypothetical protein